MTNQKINGCDGDLIQQMEAYLQRSWSLLLSQIKDLCIVLTMDHKSVKHKTSNLRYTVKVWKDNHHEKTIIVYGPNHRKKTQWSEGKHWHWRQLNIEKFKKFS